MRSRRLIRSVAIGAATIAIGGGAYGIVTATTSNGSGTATAATSRSTISAQPLSGGRGSNARSGPAAGGSSGTVDSVSASSFRSLTSAGQKVTIKEARLRRTGTARARLRERHYEGGERPRPWDDRRNEHHGEPGHRATDADAELRSSSAARWSASSAVHRRPRNKSVRSQRPIVRDRARSLAGPSQ